MGLGILEEIKKSSIELKNLEDEVSIKEKRIKLLGNQLLKYLRTLPGWENLIIHLPSAYMKNPNLIFTRGFIYQFQYIVTKIVFIGRRVILMVLII